MRFIDDMGNRIAYYSNNCSFNHKTKDIVMRLEIEIQELEKSDEPDWEAMGVRPKKTKASYKYRRCLIDTQDIEYVKEYDDKHSIIKCVWMEESVVVLAGYDDLVIKINDLENANYEEGE